MDCCVSCATILCSYLYGTDTGTNAVYLRINVKIIRLLELKDQNGDGCS